MRPTEKDLIVFGAGALAGVALLGALQRLSQSKKQGGQGNNVFVLPATPAPAPTTGTNTTQQQPRLDKPRNKVTVRVPATSANLGPGFDCIGMAVDMWSEITVERANEFSIVCEGEGATQLPLDETNLVCQGVKHAFAVAGEPLPTLKYHCVNRIPFARGLGSSSAAIVGGLVAGLVLSGKRLSVYGSGSITQGGDNVEPEELLQLAANIEGHPDNVCPAMYGGMQLGLDIGQKRWRSARVPIPDGLQLIAFIPHMTGLTSELRACLTDTVTRDQAVFNASRTAYLVNALWSNVLGNLRYGTQDVLHQPQRGAKVYHYLNPMIEACLGAGAHAAFLSGSGPTVLAITSGASGDPFTQQLNERKDRAVADAMAEVAKKFNVDGRVFITSPTDRGAHIVFVDPPFSEGVLRYSGDV